MDRILALLYKELGLSNDGDSLHLPLDLPLSTNAVLVWLW
jgi:hypothetical protein